MEKKQMISKLYDFKTLVVNKATHTKFEETLLPTGITMVSPTALVGIEVEVENIRYHPVLNYYWDGKEDGSLRNNGAEYTSIPLRGYQVPFALRYLREQLYFENKPDFSTRTSIHVHMNVRDMCEDQIKVFILLYSLFERHFFNVAGTKRETSVFCVPLYRSKQLHSIMDKDLMSIVSRWHKYNAINCGTILGTGDVPRFGTIEFRHLYGTLDIGTVTDWINQIMLLREASHQIKLEELVQTIKELNTTSEYAALYRSIFKQYARMDLMTKRDFEYCVTMTKLALFGNDYATKVPNRSNPESAYMALRYGKKQKRVVVNKHITKADIDNFFDTEDMEEPVPVPPPILKPTHAAAANAATVNWAQIHANMIAEEKAKVAAKINATNFTVGA